MKGVYICGAGSRWMVTHVQLSKNEHGRRQEAWSEANGGP
jgi:hypothetical protein